MSILVTGGLGFIGREVCHILNTLGHHVVIVDDCSNTNEGYISQFTNVTFIKESITEVDFHAVINQHNVDSVIHLAAHTNVYHSVDDPEKDANVNIIGSIRLMKACVDNKIKQCVLVSTGGALFKDTDTCAHELSPMSPKSPYGASKMAMLNYASMYSQTHSTVFVTLLLSNVYGPGQMRGKGGLITKVIDHIVHGDDFSLFGDGSNIRDYVYVHDVAQACVMCALTPCDHSTSFIVSSGKGTADIEIINKIHTMMNAPKNYTVSPSIPESVHTSVLNNGHIRKHMGWVPETSLDEGLQSVIDWVLLEKDSGTVLRNR